MSKRRKILLSILFSEVIVFSFIVAVLYQPFTRVRVFGVVNERAFGVVSVQTEGGNYLQYIPGVITGRRLEMTCNRGVWVDVLVDCVIHRSPGQLLEVEG